MSKTDATKKRPLMKDYGIVKEEKGMMSWEWVDEQMTKSRNYWICTTRPDGRPHAAPVWGVWVDGTFYFGTGEKSRKALNLARSPEVVVHLESGDDTVIIEGVMEKETNRDVELGTRIVEDYDKKYAFKPELDGIQYVLKPRVVLAWMEKDFPNTATRWEFD